MHPSGLPRGFVAGRALSVAFFIPGLTHDKLHMDQEVPGKERPRFRVMAPQGKKPFGQAYTPEKTKAWEAHVGFWALRGLRAIELDGDDDFTLPIKECRVLMSIRFNIRKPPSYPKSVIHMVKKPDLDNLVKGILDGLVEAAVLEDDNFITDLMVCKRYAGGDHPPGVEVEITALPT